MACPSCAPSSVWLLWSQARARCEALYSTGRVMIEKRADTPIMPTPIQQIASVSTPDARSLLIQPWDASVLKGIEKAILASDLGLNPQNDGRTIRLIFPALTEERRRDLVKQVKKYGEEAKVAVRNIRRDAMDKFKAQKKKSEITEDDLKIIEKDLQKLTDDYIKEVERIADEKEKELMEI